MAEHAHRDRVLDLVYGEVEGAEARALRAELESCPSCAPELAKLEAAKRLADELPMEPLPSATRAALIAAARAKANEVVASAPMVEKPRVETPRAASADGWLERLKGFLVGPQIAMVAVMLLVVTIGVWYLPGGRESPIGRTPMRPEPELDETLEPAAETVVEPQPTQEPPVVPRAELQGSELAATEQAVRSRRQPSAPRSTLGDRADDRAPAAAARAGSERATSASNAGAAAGVERDLDGLLAEPMGRGLRAAQAPREGAYAEPVPPPEAEAAPASDLEAESASLAPTAAELAPRALHQTARSHATRGDCAGAVRVYSSLFTRYPAYTELPRALVEAADCQRRLGNVSQARTLLVRAEGYPSTQADAQRELRRLSTVQQAQRRARSMPSAPASVDEAAY
jgi:hypothetical protein